MWRPLGIGTPPGEPGSAVPGRFLTSLFFSTLGASGLHAAIPNAKVRVVAPRKIPTFSAKFRFMAKEHSKLCAMRDTGCERQKCLEDQDLRAESREEAVEELVG